MAKKILCVIRTSTIRQEIESQYDDMLPFIVSKGYTEDEIEWLEAKGASARSISKEYLKMLDDIKTIISSSDTIKACAVWHLNRLGRVEHYITEIREWFTNNHIQLYVKNPDITLLNPDGTYNTGNNVLFAVFGATIPAETEEMIGKFTRGKNRNREIGRYNGGNTIAYGFKVDNEGYIVVDNEKMAHIKMLFEEYATGNWSVNKLYKEVNKRGYKFKEEWMNIVLRNEIYKPYVGELFDKCQQVFKGNVKWGTKTKESKYNHLALKVLKCPYCGHRFVAYGNDNYKCFSRNNNYKKIDSEKIDCPCPTVSVKVMDTILYDIAMLAYKWQLENIDEGSIENLQKKSNILKSKIITCTQNLDKVSDKKNRAIELYANCDIDKVKYNQLVGKCTSEYISIQAELESLNNQIEVINEQIEIAKHPNVDAWFDLCVNSANDIPVDEVKQLIRRYVKTATVDWIEYKGKKATLILVIDSLGHEHKYIYNWNIGKLPTFTVKLREILKDGTDIPYLNDTKYNSRTEHRRDEYLKAKQFHEQKKEGATI